MAKRPFRKRVKYTLIYWFILGLIAAINFFPRKWVLWVTGQLGSFAFWIFKEARLIAIENLTSVFQHTKTETEIHALAKDVFVMIGKNAGDIIRGVSVKRLEQLQRFVKIEGEEHLIAAQAKGNGVILVSAHVGAFELIGPYMGLSGYKPHPVGTPLKDERLNQLLINHRNSRGVVALERGRDTFKMLRVLKTGGMIALVNDQDTRVKSRFVSFFGRPAATPVGGTIMAQKTGASVIPLYVTMQSDNTQLIKIYPELPMIKTENPEKDLVTNTQSISNATERVILKHPSQWVWMHERWKTKPGEEIR